MNLKYLHRDNLYYEAIKKMQPAEILLDIGCGIRPQDHVQARTHICCEPFDEYIDVCMSENRKKKNFIFLKNDWDGALNLFPKNSMLAMIGFSETIIVKTPESNSTATSLN